MRLSPPSSHAILFGVALFYVLIQLCALQAPFTLDDDAGELCFIRGMSSWRDLFGIDTFGYFRPVKNLLFRLFAFAGGADGNRLWAMRLIAIALGVLTLFPIHAILRRMLPTSRQAAFAAGVWLLAPTLVSCTAFLSCFNIQLMAAFAALALCCHDRGQTVLAALAFFVATLCYEGGAATLALFVAFDFFLRPDRLHTPRYWLRYALYAGTFLLYLALRYSLGTPGTSYGSFPLGTTRLEVAFSSPLFIGWHLRAWLFPFNRFVVMTSYAWGDVPVWLLSAGWLLLAALAAAILYFRRRAPIPAFGLAWFFIAFAPMSNLLGFKNGPYGDYYLALASLGLACFTVWLVAALMTKSQTLTAGSPPSVPNPRLSACFRLLAILLIAIRALAVLESAAWASYWNDAKVMFAKSVETFPDSYLWRLQLAKLACDAGQDAIAWNRVNEVRAAHPDAPGCLPILATLESRRGRYSESLAHIHAFLEQVPGDVNALLFEASLQDQVFHRPAAAERLYREALRSRVCAETPKAARALADLLDRQRRPAEAAPYRALADRLTR